MSEVLVSFELSPDHQHRSLDVAVKPKYPSQELRDEEKPHTVEPRQHRTVWRFLQVLTVTIIAAASLHIITFGILFNEVPLSSSTGGKMLSEKTNYLRSKIRNLLKAHPRTIFLGDRFRPILGRKIVQYPTEYSDKTQLYHTKSSDDASVSTSMERKIFPNHETNENCVPMSEWQQLTYPTCNNVHESFGGANGLQDDSLRFLSNAGSWRDAWRYKADVPHSPDDKKQMTDNVILKTIKLHHPMEERYFEFSRVDALAMEQLTSNPYVMNIHDFCGVSVVTERGEDVLGKTVQRLSPRAKVELAVKVALSLAAIHEHGLVHNDLNADNIFMGKKNNPKLNDFNIAILMMTDNRTNSTCPFPGHFPNAQWKSPEEQDKSPTLNELTEKVDIYALGNLLFQLATNNKRPWREMADGDGVSLTTEQKTKVSHLKMEGVMPKVPEMILKLSDPYINLLLETMEKCYQLKPEDRPTAREVAEFLDMRKKSLDEIIMEFGRFPKNTAGFDIQTKTLANTPLKVPSKLGSSEVPKASVNVVPVQEERATPVPIVRGPV